MESRLNRPTRETCESGQDTCYSSADKHVKSYLRILKFAGVEMEWWCLTCVHEKVGSDGGCRCLWSRISKMNQKNKKYWNVEQLE